MRNLREYNEEILDTYYKLDNYNDLAMPLLVFSKDDYFNSFERKILYILLNYQLLCDIIISIKGGFYEKRNRSIAR